MPVLRGRSPSQWSLLVPFDCARGNVTFALSESELQSELQLARVERAACLAEFVVQVVESRRPCRVAQLEIGVIENVEPFCAELQAEPLGKLEGLEDGSVHRPVSRAHKCVATQIADATQAGRGKEFDRKIEAVGPLRVSRIHMVRNRVRTVIRYPVQVVVRAPIFTIDRIEGSGIASSWVPLFCLELGVGKRASAERGPVGAALERPDSVPLPSAQNRPQRSVSVPEERQLPDIVESKALTDVENGVTTVQARKRQVSTYAIARRKAVCRSLVLVTKPLPVPTRYFLPDP